MEDPFSTAWPPWLVGVAAWLGTVWPGVWLCACRSPPSPPAGGALPPRAADDASSASSSGTGLGPLKAPSGQTTLSFCGSLYRCLGIVALPGKIHGRGVMGRRWVRASQLRYSAHKRSGATTAFAGRVLRTTLDLLPW